MKLMPVAMLMSLALMAGCGDKDEPIDSVVVADDTGDPTDLDADGYFASEDCDDNDFSINPGALEVCDGVDNNCDGAVDENVTTTYYQDADTDGFGDDGQTIEACERPSGYALVGNDCDDGDANVYPGNLEICDGLDNNCDGDIDEGQGATYYADADSDGYGDPESGELACFQPEGYVTNADDCDDADVFAYPGASETCDEADNDCDSSVDEGVTTTFWIDLDTDSYGDSSNDIEACSLPTGYAEVDGDCDDTEPLANPGETEVCDSIDNNCDGTVDEDTAADASTWYADADSDAYGDANSSTLACNQPSGYVADNTDCNDAEGASFPGNTEVCDSIDNDCNNLVDDGATDAGTWYADADTDTFGDANVSQESCTQPSGYVTDNTDCDDTDITSFPGGIEVCDGADNDCNTIIDDNPTDGDLYYSDSDGDGAGDPASTTVACSLPTGYADNDWDCNDADATEPKFADVVNGTTSGSGSITAPMFSLQSAVDASLECVRVHPGTYREALDMSGLDIEVTSISGPSLTYIDPGYAPCSAATLASGTCAAYAPSVTFASGNGGLATLDGFTVSGGTGYADVSTITTDCADSSASYSGSNTCTVTVYEFCGGGVYIDGDDPTLANLIIDANDLPVFEQYRVPASDFEQVWVYSSGGGVCANDTALTMSGTELVDNMADQGGGIYVSSGSSVDFSQGIIAGNNATDGAGANLDGGSMAIENSLILNNSAVTDGGGVFQQTSGVATLTNITMSQNTSSTTGTARGDALYGGASTSATVHNSIITGDGVSSNAQAYSVGTTASDYSDWYTAGGSGAVYGTGWTAGANDINADPRFTTWSVDGDHLNDDYTVRSTSPTIDVGDPTSTYNDADTTPNDMGAYGGPNGVW